MPHAILRDNFGASESGNDGEITLDDNGNLRVPATDRMLVVDEELREVPRAVVLVPEVRRRPAGKADYKWAEEVAREQAGQAPLSPQP